MPPEATPATAASNAPFPLHPLPATGGACPRCDRPLELRRLHFPGSRSLLEGDCPDCGHRYLQDLPAGHGLRYPVSVDMVTGESWGRWFNDDLIASWQRPDSEPVALDVDVRREASDVVLLNCLDFIYGHSLLRLFNASRHLTEREDLVLLVPAALAPLAPAGAVEVWTVGAPLGRLRGWLLELDAAVSAELARFDRCVLSPGFPHPHPSTFDLADFTGAVSARATGAPSVAFVLREERRWGGSAEDQERRVSATWQLLADRFPEAGAVVVGVGRPREWPAGLVDMRTALPDASREREWISSLAGADIAVGVHGSNMLLPSALARATIELLPAGRFHNYGQATVVTDTDPVAALLRHHTLHGDDHLADVTPERVADLATAVLQSGPDLHESMLGPLAGQPSSDASAPARRFSTGVSPAKSADSAPVVRRAAASGRAVVAEWRRRAAARRREAALRRRVGEIGAPAVLEDSRGHSFRLVDRDEVEQFLTYGGATEAREIELAAAYLERGATAVDIGGHIGKFAIPMGAAVGPAGIVHTFEPVPESYERLVANLALNDVQQVRAHQTAISDRAGEEELALYGAGRASWSSLVPRSIERPDFVVRPEGAVRVPTTTLDDAAQDLGFDHIDFLKIDVEGAEGKVLDGASRLFESGAVDALLIELSDETLNPAGTSAVEILDRLVAWGLRPFVLSDDGLVPFRQLGPLDHLVNVLAVAPTGLARVREAGL